MPRSPHVAAFLALLVLPVLLVVPATHASDPWTLPQRTSPPVSVVGWADAPTMVPTGATYGVSLRVSGGPRPVRLERHVGRAWRTVAVARTDADGRVALRWSAPHRRTRVALRVVVPGAYSRPAATTRMRVVKVRLRSAWDGLSPRLKRVHALVNEARTSGQRCGDRWFPPVGPVRVNARLNRAAGRFAADMASRDYFSHNSLDGSSAGDRIDASGYDWRSYGENIAGGHDTADDVVRGWLNSPGHCENIMGQFAEIGLGFADDPDSTYERYWVQDFATR